LNTKAMKATNHTKWIWRTKNKTQR